jgi:hypothetical protein
LYLNRRIIDKNRPKIDSNRFKIDSERELSKGKKIPQLDFLDCQRGVLPSNVILCHFSSGVKIPQLDFPVR